MKKTLAAIALAGSITLIGAAPSMAANYPPLPPQAAVSDGTVGPGEQFVFRGQGFLAGEGLTISVTPGNPPAANGSSVSNGSRTVPTKITLPLAPQNFSAKADANGAFAFPLSISESGTYTLTATGTSGRTVGPVTVVVVAPAGLANTGGAPLANTGAGLANTGADASLVLWSLVGAGALAAGATSVVVVRRRAKAEAAA
ncbi:LPXTG-motif cell wall-anchored protein [Arthrobacter sp. PvP102]|uniref:LPXTG cell wall anchor domain-containing protein n=1 Tax=unclassified Arthrobacter TaxID=235627 RepID=UPI001AEA5EC5|nr:MULTISPECIES: LPXTG cell wall anchor domain-containing protein [unclassified Arthrobacter]MBP1232524.1 LPXTG-motif cell wall-anchored protein [Arthrobacter sp. PvP103]MBP1237659.1 LPXTG-motif cell wall-anchored protein [Arthrobacter sp. PvP102]